MRSDRKWSLVSITLAVLASVAVLASMQWSPGPTAGAQAGSSQRGSTPLDCYQYTQEHTLLAEGPAFLLCRGADSSAPARCYEAGRKETGLTNRQLFDLCRCAESTAPVNCFERASKDTFLLDERAIQLCSPVVTENLRLNCTPID